MKRPSKRSARTHLHTFWVNLSLNGHVIPHFDVLFILNIKPRGCAQLQGPHRTYVSLKDYGSLLSFTPEEVATIGCAAVVDLRYGEIERDSDWSVPTLKMVAFESDHVSEQSLAQKLVQLRIQVT